MLRVAKPKSVSKVLGRRGVTEITARRAEIAARHADARDEVSPDGSQIRALRGRTW